MKKWHGGKIWGLAWVWQPQWEVRQKALSKFSVVIRVRSMDLSIGKSRQLRDDIREEEFRWACLYQAAASQSTGVWEVVERTGWEACVQLGGKLYNKESECRLERESECRWEREREQQH